MAFILGSISVLSFIAYFYAIGYWYIGLIPLLVLIVAIVYYISGISIKSKGQFIFQKYGLFLAWIVIMFGLLGVLKFFNISFINSYIFLIGLNIIFLFLSYLIKYEDGKSVSYFAYYMCTIVLLIHISISYNITMFFQGFTMFWFLSLGILAFVYFILGMKYDIKPHIKYILFTFVLGAIVLILYHKIENIYIFLISLSIILSILYSYIYSKLSNRPPTDTEIKEVSVRRILAGEKVLKKYNKNDSLARNIYNFFDNLPKPLRFFLEGLNIMVILVIIYLYFKNALLFQGQTEQIFYWIITVGFIFNVFLLKKLNYTSSVQRLLTFMVINFAIYVSLFSAFAGDISRIVFLAMVRNILCAIMVFYIHKTKVGQYLQKIDYLFWILTTVSALIVNIILLFKTNINTELMIPIILLYLGIQFMILFYSIKYIYKIKELIVYE